MKKIILIVVAVAVIAGGIYLWKVKTGKAQSTDTQSKIGVVQRGTIEQNVEATGSVVSKKDVEIKCKASGEIISLPFDVSAKVKKGDLILELDPTDEERSVAKSRIALNTSQARLAQSASELEIAKKDLTNSRKQAEVDLESARIGYEDASAKEDREKQLLDKKLASKEEYDTAHTTAVQSKAKYDQAILNIEQLKIQDEALEQKRQDLKMAKSDLESARISLTIVEQGLKDTKIQAPTDGTITALNVQTGQIIASGINNIGGGTSVMTISDLSQLYVLASIDESDIGNVKVGQQVTITADAYPKETFTGLVDRIAQMGVSTSNVVTFEVRIEVTSDNKQLLKPEMTTNVKIVLQKKEDVLYVPATAVFNEDQKQADEAAATGKAKQPVVVSPVVSVRSAGGTVSAGRKGRAGWASSAAGKGRAGGMRKLKQYVTVVSPDGTKEVREVETGMTDGENIEIVSGLKEGEQIETREDSVSSKWSGSGSNRGPRGPMGM
jgi:HlyD family secretion protein